MAKQSHYFLFLFFIYVLTGSSALVTAQPMHDTLNGRNLYHPQSSLDSMAIQDSLQHQHTIDSLALVRIQFIRDSIEAREIFVRDSIAHRQYILDSLNNIVQQLPRLLEAALKTFSDNILVTPGRINIVGDSVLSNYVSKVLPLTTDQPYTPWLNTIDLSERPIKLTLDERTKRITTIQASGISGTYANNPGFNLVTITGKGIIASTPKGKVFKSNVDSVFFNPKGHVSKVKRSILFSQVINNFQQGPPLFTQLTQVKQFEYSADNQLSSLEIVNFCERSASGDPKKVCFMVTYAISRQGNNFLMTRRNDPPNEYSDGTFTYEFDEPSVLKSIAFINFRKTEDWKTFIELNEMGYVSSYVYQNKGIVKNTLLFNYNLNDPGAKNKIETISCTFEDDGVSYYQLNNTTGKSRVRDRMTMEWSAWK